MGENMFLVHKVKHLIELSPVDFDIVAWIVSRPLESASSATAECGGPMRFQMFFLTVKSWPLDGVCVVAKQTPLLVVLLCC